MLVFWVQRGRLTQEGHNLLIDVAFPFLVEKMFPARARVQSPVAFWCHSSSAPARKKSKRERATFWFATSLEKIVVFPPSLKSCNFRSWIYGGSRANRTNYFISQCNTAVKVSATVVPHASLLHKKNCTHTCMHMHTHAQNGNLCCKMHAFEVGQDIYCQEGNQQEIMMTATKHIQERFEQNWRENFEHLYSSGRKA